ncbi:MAG TPA: hypothetical protein VH371_02855, partial [Candidatus Limnocylindrales bacterium]
RLYPNGARIRDVSQAPRLMALVRRIGAPLHCRTEVPLPPRNATPELRAWDAVIEGSGERTGVELEPAYRLASDHAEAQPETRR